MRVAIISTLMVMLPAASVRADEPAKDLRRLLEDLKSSDIQERCHAARMLGDAKVIAAVPALVKALDDDSESVRTRVAYALIDIVPSNTVAGGERVRLITNPAFYPENEYAHGDEYGTWFLGTMWAENHLDAAIGSIGIPLNYNPQTTSYIRFAASNTGGAFSSKHSGGGVNFVYLDGSVHYLDPTVADSVRLALGTIQGGETVTLP